MKLHQDKDSFEKILNKISRASGHRLGILEKDYYVTAFLYELAQMQQEGLPVYFKGGTALYKALKATNRFSEDIDLSVNTDDCPSGTQKKKLLEKSAKGYTVLARNKDESHTNRSEALSIFDYDSLLDANDPDMFDPLERFKKVKIEVTSFTISKPTDEKEISPLIYDFAEDKDKEILESVFEVRPFVIKTISISRIFIDKLFAMEAYIRRVNEPDKALETAKHMYDLVILSNHPEIVPLYNDYEELKYLLNIRLKEELSRLDGVAGTKPEDFTCFSNMDNNEKLMQGYQRMENVYIFSAKDKIPYKQVVDALHQIHDKLSQNPAWFDCQIKEKNNVEESEPFCPRMR